MKAKEYAKRVVDGENDIGNVAMRMIQEMEEIGKQRHARTDVVFFPIVKEQIRKWKAFTKAMKKYGIGVKEDGLAIVMKAEMPWLYDALLVQIPELRIEDEEAGNSEGKK